MEHDIPVAYLVFAGPEYYPLGGALDFVGAAPDLYSAQVLLETRIRDQGIDAKYHINWAHVACWDGDRLAIVAEWCPDHMFFRRASDQMLEPDDLGEPSPAVLRVMRWYPFDAHRERAQLDVWLVDGWYYLPKTQFERR